MKHDDVVALLKAIDETGKANHISKEHLDTLKSYNLIDVAKGEENHKSPACLLTKKGRVMLKANSKPKP